MPQTGETRKQHKHRGEPTGQNQPLPPGTHDASSPHEEPVRRNRRYYDDSDDMIDRVRRVRAAFEKRINGFQGADWPHYVKRTIVGKKKTEQPSATDNAAPTNHSAPRHATPTLPFARPLSQQEQQ